MAHHMRESGNLLSRLLTDPELQSEYTALSDRAHYQPSIYAHFLTDTQGTPPTPSQYLTISNMVQDYLAENTVSQHAWHVDNMTHPPVPEHSSNNGHRKYLHTTNSTKSRSAKRPETLHRFCNDAHQRWLDTPTSLRDTPFICPPAEVGYSRHSHCRLRQHRLRQSSNYIMNLVEDICCYLHRSGVFTQQFSMDWYVIFLLFRKKQAAIAEIFCSGLLQVWVQGGGGFNASPAGRSVATAKRVGEGEWAGYEKWVREESDVVKNMRLQQQRAEEWRRALEWEDRESKESHCECAQVVDVGLGL
ncbi:hypothetical protein COCSADRAFT_191549 [Bipolaris sorokiniana ND90Pr]|uniref:Uncharacterized protein n=1 Tax=Cochliobolus sativus (strain ND90Pr / ATCC 201652) TaxID=665912 RepID=M2SIQ8_COCSN|nr:uncharacterized protein COCSADRAFT_191549 [Bipolaris sorokiniana ND90Pr]EMD62260.1 hypothetical protein COCSADRAFT_191549 [Bipolaris sorokiniana ND90Pr]